MKQVYAFGTFDGIHRGHIAYLEQAKALGGRLTVVIARDINIQRHKKHPSELSETERLALVRSLGIADEVKLGTTGRPLDIFATEPIDVVVLGYDQPFIETDIVSVANRYGRKVAVVRAQPYLEQILQTKRLKRLGWIGNLLRRRR